ncbi:MAG: F0F1 ATP synthase subunit epsilon [Oscillospiraceae bacterium]|nr:F0F1 ATP synthase subunit epsilon [Oscillospiraceae bacterium]
MKTFLLKISSPEGDLFSEEVISIRLRGSEGELAVLAGHIPFVSSVKPCSFKIELSDGEEKEGRTGGGMLSVSKDKTVFLTGNVEWKN